MLHIIGKLNGYDELTAKFRDMPSVIEKATVSALNKLGTRGLTATKKGIGEVYNVEKDDIAKMVTRVPAKRAYGGKQSRLFTTIIAKGSRIPLMKFGGQPSTPANQRGVQVSQRIHPTVKIMRQAGARQVTRDSGTGHMPFVARMRSGFGGSTTDHVGIFVRTDKWAEGNRWRGGKARHQVIRQLMSKGIAELFASKGRAQLDALVVEKGSTIMAASLQQFLEKAMKSQALPTD
jgi:hypothetical protein